MEHSEGYMTLVTLAKDLESLGYDSITPAQLRKMAEVIEAELIMINSDFDSVETIEDFNL